MSTEPTKKSLAGLRRVIPTGIAMRLAVGFSVLLFMLIAMAIENAQRIDTLANGFTSSLDQTLPRIDELQKLVDEVTLVSLSARDAMIAPNAAAAKAHLDKIQAARSIIGKQVENLQKNLLADAGYIPTPDDPTSENPPEVEDTPAIKQAKEQAETIAQHSSGILVGLVQFSRLMQRGRAKVAGKILIERLEPKLVALTGAVVQFRADQMKRLDQARTDAATEARRSKQYSLIIVAVSILIAMVIGHLTSRSIARPIASAANLGKAVASGDLTYELTVKGRDECAVLASTMINMRDGLVDIVQGVRERCDLIALSAKEIATGNLDLSQRTEDQAAGLEITTGTASRITERVKKNAELAVSAASIAEGASQIAITGNKHSIELAATVNQISGHASKVADFIAVIDNIAFQTNILALNAAVEAARAGVHGQGFAVVANEVRNLSQRATQAANDIKPLIQTTLDKVQEGSRRADESAESLNAIAKAVGEVTELMANISSATTEQAGDLEQINQAIVSLESTTQQNAALVEQVAAAASSSQEQVDQLVETVSIFVLPSQTPAHA